MNLILQRVDDSELIRRIDAANSSVALYAPGVSVAVAWALHRAAWRLGGAIKVVLDVSQKSVDMGIIERYGSGIKRIKKECDKNGNPYPEWSDIYGEFATTYRPRFASGERQKENSPIDGLSAQRAGDALKNALKNALKGSRKSSGDDIVAKITQVYGEIVKNPSVSLSAIAQELGLSDRTVDEYVAILKNAGALRRKDGKRFGTWEILM